MSHLDKMTLPVMIHVSVLSLLIASTAHADDGVVRMSMFRTGPLPNGAMIPTIENPIDLEERQAIIQLGGMPTLVNFWASWCKPCVDEMPDIEAIAKKYEGRVRVIGLSGDENRRDAIALVKRLGITYPNYVVDEQTQFNFQVKSFPSTYIFDATGRLQWSIAGAVTAAILDDELTRVIGPTAGTIEPGEIVFGGGVVIRSDGVILSPYGPVEYAQTRLTAVIPGTASRYKALGLLGDDEDKNLAIIKVDAQMKALAFADSVAVGTEVSIGDRRGTITEANNELIKHSVDVTDIPSGTPLLDNQGRVVGMTTVGSSATPANVLREFVATVNLDAAPKPIGPNVERNVVISTVFFSVVVAITVLVFVAPSIKRKLARRRAMRAIN